MLDIPVSASLVLILQYATRPPLRSLITSLTNKTWEDITHSIYVLMYSARTTRSDLLHPPPPNKAHLQPPRLGGIFNGL